MKITKSELKTIIREILREELEKQDPFFNEEPGKRLSLAARECVEACDGFK